MANSPLADRRSWMLVGAALAIGTVVRLVGLGYGLPEIYNPDEVAIMNRAIGLGQNSLNPHNFLYPSLYFYALFVWEGAWFALGRTVGVFHSLAEFERLFFTDPTTIYLAGRLLTALCGVLTIWATFQLTTRIFSQVAGAASALLLALAPLAVRDAHYVKHDVPVTWLIVLTHVLIARDLVGPVRHRRWWLPGAVAGLAMSTHYYAVFLAVPLTFWALMPAFPGEGIHLRVRRLIVTAAITSVAFFAASPFLLVEPGTAMRDIVANREIVVDRATAASGSFGSLVFYMTWLTRDGAGIVTTLLAVTGLLSLARAGWRRVALVIGFPIAFLLFLSNTVPASRYLNPIVPFVSVLAGGAVATLIAQRSLLRLIGAFLLAAAAVEGGAASAHADLFFRQADTRTEALQWIQQTLPAGTSVLVQPYSVPLRPTRDALAEALTANLGSAGRATIKFRRLLALEPYPSPSYRPIYLGSGGLDADKIYLAPSAIAQSGSLEPLRRLAVTHVVLKRYNVEDPSTRPLSTALRREGRLLAAFSPYQAGLDAPRQEATPPFLHNSDARIAPGLERPGPIIEIWTID